jgi:hypothetical protein
MDKTQKEIIRIIESKMVEYTSKSSAGNIVRTNLSKKDIYRNELCKEIIKDIIES